MINRPKKVILRNNTKNNKKSSMWCIADSVSLQTSGNRQWFCLHRNIKVLLFICIKLKCSPHFYRKCDVTIALSPRVSFERNWIFSKVTNIKPETLSIFEYCSSDIAPQFTCGKMGAAHNFHHHKFNRKNENMKIIVNGREIRKQDNECNLDDVMAHQMKWEKLPWPTRSHWDFIYLIWFR